MEKHGIQMVWEQTKLLEMSAPIGEETFSAFSVLTYLLGLFCGPTILHLRLGFFSFRDSFTAVERRELA
jgi:hypothetical protein